MKPPNKKTMIAGAVASAAATLAASQVIPDKWAAMLSAFANFIPFF